MITPSLEHESVFWDSGLSLVAGLDEVGRGSLAGPVVAGAVIFPPDVSLLAKLLGVRDSKTLSAKQRQKALVLIKEHALAYSVGEVDAPTVDLHGIVAGVKEAMRLALATLSVQPQALIIDALTLKGSWPQDSFPKADAHSLSVAAASIVAKEYRDELMRNAAPNYPGYGLERNVGYASKEHMDALKALGPTPFHRRSFLGFLQVKEPEINGVVSIADTLKEKAGASKNLRSDSYSLLDD